MRCKHGGKGAAQRAGPGPRWKMLERLSGKKVIPDLRPGRVGDGQRRGRGLLAEPVQCLRASTPSTRKCRTVCLAGRLELGSN